MTAETLIEEFKKLPPDEQFEFQVQFDQMTVLDDTYDDGEGDGPDGEDLPQALKDLLQARIDKYEADPSSGMTLDEFKIRLEEMKRCVAS